MNSRKNVCVFYHDGFSQHEIGLALEVLKENDIFSTALENRVYVSAGKQKVVPDTTLDQLRIKDVDLLIIPGGGPQIKQFFTNERLKGFVLDLHQRKKYVAGICWGADLVEEYGITREADELGDTSTRSRLYQALLSNKLGGPNIHVSRRDNVIMANGIAVTEFAFELAKVMGVFESEEERLEKYRFYKNADCVYPIE